MSKSGHVIIFKHLGMIASFQGFAAPNIYLPDSM